LSPDGRQLVYERNFFDPQKDRKRSNLWLIDVASGARRPLTTGSVHDNSPAWSPDGKRIAYLGADGDRTQVYVRWLDGGAVARVTQVEHAQAAAAPTPAADQ
jgi:acylaminoacyl-peptidase